MVSTVEPSANEKKGRMKSSLFNQQRYASSRQNNGSFPPIIGWGRVMGAHLRAEAGGGASGQNWGLGYLAGATTTVQDQRILFLGSS